MPKSTALQQKEQHWLTSSWNSLTAMVSVVGGLESGVLGCCLVQGREKERRMRWLVEEVSCEVVVCVDVIVKRVIRDGQELRACWGITVSRGGRGEALCIRIGRKVFPMVG